MQVWLCTRLSDAGESGQGTPGTLFSIPLLRWQELPCQEPHGELGEADVATKGHHRAALNPMQGHTWPEERCSHSHPHRGTHLLLAAPPAP